MSFPLLAVQLSKQLGGVLGTRLVECFNWLAAHSLGQYMVTVLKMSQPHQYLALPGAWCHLKKQNSIVSLVVMLFCTHCRDSYGLCKLVVIVVLIVDWLIL